MRSTNPVFGKRFDETYSVYDKPATVTGTMTKLMILSLILMIAAGAVYYQFSLAHLDFVKIMMNVGVWTGLVFALIITFKPTLSPYLAPLYAFAEGAALSGISCYAEAALPGIVIQAASITMITLLLMAVLYKTGLIKATEKFRAVLLTAGMAIFAFYMISLILMLFRVNIPYFSSNSIVSIVINAVIAVVAALYLILDFDFIEKAQENRLPAVFEWYGAFGLLVTIVWLYLEILKLLSRLRSR